MQLFEAVAANMYQIYHKDPPARDRGAGLVYARTSLLVLFRRPGFDVSETYLDVSGTRYGFAAGNAFISHSVWGYQYT